MPYPINSYLKIIISLLLLVLTACEKKQEEKLAISVNTNGNSSSFAELTLTSKPGTDRWYFSEQAERGKAIFAANCATCHGNSAEATPDWRTPNDSGHYPPPPLNGSAHAWHHPLSILGRTIYFGGAPVGGQMPPFKDKLTETNIVDVIAHFQTYWPDDIYDRWLQIENNSRR